MPSSILNAINGPVNGHTANAPAQSPATVNPIIDQNFMSQLTQFANTVAPMMRGLNPQNVFMSFMAKQGYTQEQAQQLINQFSAQATEIQKQLTGMK